MPFDQGTVVFVQKRNDPPDANGRPAVIVSESRSNRYSADVVVCYLSHDTKRQRESDVVVSQFRDGKSFVVSRKPVTVVKNRISGFEGKLTPQEMTRVKLALTLAFGL